MPELSRRDLVGKLAIGTAIACTAGVARSSVASIRRDEITPLGVAPAENAVVGTASAPVAVQALVETHSVESGQADAPPAASPPAPWKLLRPLAMGSAVGHGWRVAGLTGIEDGSCVLTLENGRGRTHRVHLCANAGRPQGLVYTKRCDLVVMNGGQGDLPTEEGLAQAVAAVAHVLAANEGDGRHGPVVAALLPHAERVERFAAAAKLR